ncbi:hypothetical protein NDU88_003626 [Pleurodeles waltl]|uniref:L1 transposable element RRM domain-containing protein n=1 Tax=Pleurodeles waltl TaxID=8319 RepID=A0AAV7UE85_PLEWA|nr:hypothetical protein NDU88_003626 [Pleurodeles waltl]
MCGGFSPTNINSGTSAGLTRAALELTKSRQAATCVPLRGTAGIVSTSREAEQVAFCRTGLLQKDPSLLLSSSKPKKFDLVALRTQALEESMEMVKEELSKNKEEIKFLKESENSLQDKLEHLENSLRRNNRRILKVSEGAEGDDLKKYVVSFIKKSMPIEESEAEIIKDIQRIHKDPFRKDSKREKPRKILVNFQTYQLKEKILAKALGLGSLKVEEFSFEIRSDLSSMMLNRQWQLGKRL